MVSYPGYVLTVAAYCNTEGKLRLSNSTTPADDNANALWCVVGSETDGYKFYNKASGTSKVLLASRVLNSADASFQMADAESVGALAMPKRHLSFYLNLLITL